MKLPIALVVLLGLTLAAAPAVSQTLYSNGLCSLPLVAVLRMRSMWILALPSVTILRLARAAAAP